MSVRRPARAAAALLVSLLVPLVAPPADASTYPPPRSDEWWFTAWGVQDKLWPISRGAGVTVGVVDSGVQAGLPELAGSVLPGADFTHRGGDGRTDLDLPVIANDESSTAQAVRYATDDGAKVINISLGGPRRCTNFTQEAVAYAIRHDVVVEPSGSLMWPSGLPAATWAGSPRTASSTHPTGEPARRPR